jgi:hypothetical protein
MDLWDYLRALRGYWWLALGIPVLAFMVAFAAIPAPWQTQFRAIILFPANPDLTALAQTGEAIVYDDAALLVDSDAFRQRVHAELPAELRSVMTPDQIGSMVTGSRYSRAVTMTISGSSRERVKAVANATESAFPEAVKTFIMPPEWAATEVEYLDHTGDPVRQTRERWVAVGAITVAAFLCGLGIVALTETLRRSYRLKYGAK